MSWGLRNWSRPSIEAWPTIRWPRSSTRCSEQSWSSWTSSSSVMKGATSITVGATQWQPSGLTCDCSSWLLQAGWMTWVSSLESGGQDSLPEGSQVSLPPGSRFAMPSGTARSRPAARWSARLNGQSRANQRRPEAGRASLLPGPRRVVVPSARCDDKHPVADHMADGRTAGHASRRRPLARHQAPALAS